MTILQRRLASSPEAILRSLQRRRRRLEARRTEVASGRAGGLSGRADAPSARVGTPSASPVEAQLAEFLGTGLDYTEEDLEDLTAGEREQAEEAVVDAASAARTVAELDKEVAILADLEELARRVRRSGTDKKWTELRALLLDEQSMYDAAGNRRKIIIFTEHRDTLSYLVHQIRALLGRDDVVVAIHGGLTREARRAAQELFTQDRDVQVLVATDAAGEGLNLQRAHLMVNYDLPWNPNRIEQRFGRIHRIGQTEVCRLWNLVAVDTREGAVFQRLLDKVEEQRRAYHGKVFDVLGQAFEGRPLRDLLIEAIRYGEQPEVRARLDEVVDAEVSAGLDKLLAERALHHDVLAEADVRELRLRMEEARARRLQPHYVQEFFAEAFALLGGRMSPRETGRFEITHVPAEARERDRQIGLGAPVLRRYERVCFEREHVRRPGKPQAELIAPGHPLLDTVVDLVIERYGTLLKRGTLLVDTRDPSEEPRLLVALTQAIQDGHTPPRTISKRFDFVEIAQQGATSSAGAAPYLDYRAPSDEERTLAARLLDEPWLATGLEAIAINWAVQHGMSEHLAQVSEQVRAAVGRTRVEVHRRLTQEINHWDLRHAELLDQQAAGRTLKIKPETAERRARDLERRLERRLRELDADETLHPLPPTVAGGALVIPRGALDRLAGQRDQPPDAYATATAEVDRRAVSAVLAAERALGRVPEEMPHNNAGYDIRSLTPDGHWVFLEVKGRIAGAEDFFVTRNEVLVAKNADRYRLALVRVAAEGAEYDEVRYVLDPFARFEFGDFAADGVRGVWEQMWARGRRPL